MRSAMIEVAKLSKRQYLKNKRKFGVLMIKHISLNPIPPMLALLIRLEIVISVIPVLKIRGKKTMSLKSHGKNIKGLISPVTRLID